MPNAAAAGSNTEMSLNGHTRGGFMLFTINHNRLRQKYINHYQYKLKTS